MLVWRAHWDFPPSHCCFVWNLMWNIFRAKVASLYVKGGNRTTYAVSVGRL